MTKRFPLGDLDEPVPWDYATVAEVGGTVTGFLAARHHSWHRRIELWHLYMDAAARRQGIARALLADAVAWGRSVGAEVAWLETSTVNVPGIDAYRRLGVALCGLDTTLYHGTPAEDEVALYLARPIGR